MATRLLAMTSTPTQRLASLILGRPVQDWIHDRRRAGRSWRLIARDLYEATNGQIDITHQAARNWADEPDRAAS